MDGLATGDMLHRIWLMLHSCTDERRTKKARGQLPAKVREGPHKRWMLRFGLEPVARKMP